MGQAADRGDVSFCVKDYYAGLVAVDENIGRIVDYLGNKNLLENTAIVQTSDHRFFLGEYRLFDKRLMHEPSIRVPLMIRYPKRIKLVTVRDAIPTKDVEVHSVDTATLRGGLPWFLRVESPNGLSLL